MTQKSYKIKWYNIFKVYSGIQYFSVGSGRNSIYHGLNEKKHVLVYDINKILRVVLASGTAGLNSASKVLEPGFSMCINYSLLAQSLDRISPMATASIYSYSPKLKASGKGYLLYA